MAIALRSHLFRFSLHSTGGRKKSGKLYFSLLFEDRLRIRLQALLLFPESSPSISLSWLTDAVRLLSSILRDAAEVFSDPSLSSADRCAIASYLNSSIRLLDSCNFITAAADRHLSDLLLLRLAVRYLSSSGVVQPLAEKVRRARQLLLEWEARSTGVVDSGLIPPPSARGTLSAVERVIFAVEAVSCLVIAAAVSVLGGGEGWKKENLASISGGFLWSSAFDDVKAAFSGRIGKGFPDEMELVKSSVRKLAAVMDEAKDGKDEERMQSSVLAVARAEGKLTVEMERLSHAVEEMFTSAMLARTAALQSFCLHRQKHI